MNYKKIQIWTIMSLFLATIGFVACEENDSVKMQDVTLKATLPEFMEGVDADGLTVEFINKATESIKTSTLDASGQLLITVEQGLYDIKISGKKIYSQAIDETTINSQEVNLIGFKESVAISSTSGTLEIPLKISIPNKGWVIKEYYFAGSKTPSGSAYNKDQFIEIYNNTDTVMYADGISFGEVENTTSQGPNVYADEIDQSTFVRALYTIPGTGKEHPVQPGNSILIAPQPINHKETVPASVDLSEADFQFYDSHATLSIQVPEVPDMIRYYLSSKTILTFHNRGAWPILIFKAPDMENYVSQYTDTRNNKAGNPITTVRIPNEYILDAVESAPSEGITSKAFSASVDLGFVGCGPSGTGKSIRRKVAEIKNGRVIYQDTNNSSVDFIPDATPQPKVFGNN